MNERKIQEMVDVLNEEGSSRYVIANAGFKIVNNQSYFTGATPLEQLDALERYTADFEVIADKTNRKVTENAIDHFVDYMIATLTDINMPKTYHCPIGTVRNAARGVLYTRPEEIMEIARKMSVHDEMKAMQMFLEQASDLGLPDAVMTEEFEF